MSLQPVASKIPTPHVANRLQVSHIGLSPREVLVLDTLFRVQPDLKGRYSFVSAAHGEQPSIVFINGDDQASIAAWHVFRARHPGTVAIQVSTTPPSDGDEVALGGPISFRNLEDLRAALAAVNPGSSVETGNRGGLRVLVVDDSALAREILQGTLAKAANSSNTGMDVDFANCGEDALAKAENTRYDLVFLDVVMPGLDGYEVCRQLKQRHKPRVAMLSSRREAVDYELGRAAGCDHYLAKPAPADMVSTVVRLTALKKSLPVH